DARPARRTHRLRPRRADDRRTPRCHRALAAAIRVTRIAKVDSLVVQVCDDDARFGEAAATQAAIAIRDAIEANGVANAMFATGNSQFAFIAALVAKPGIEWDRVVAFHMDEYVGLPPSHPASFQRYMRERLAAHVPIKTFHYLQGDAPDPEKEA